VLTVTANDASRAYGAANPTFTPNYSGFVNGETLGTSGVSGAPSLTTTAGTSSPVVAGGYAITSAKGTLASTNYSFAFAPGTLTVEGAVLTVTANDASRAYGAANPTFTPNYSGFVNGETLGTSGVSGAPSLTTTAGTSSPVVVGGYAITAAKGTLASTNYSFAFAAGTLTVGKITATVSAVAKSKSYGAADPALTTTNSGFLAGDVGPAKITFSASRAPGETVAGGPYTITPVVSDNASGLLGSYTVKLNTADFTISKKVASVTPTANSKTYGVSDPTLSGTKTGFLSADHVIATYSRTAGETVAGSPYTITAVLSPAAILTNYDITQNSAEFTIAKATLHTGPGGTIVINHYDVTYNGASHTATGSVTGVKGEDLTNLLTLSGSTHTTIGNYATDPWTFAGNANYKSAHGIVTPADKIGGKTITVTAAGIDKAYDGTKTANVTLSTNKVGSDKVTASFTGASFADKHVGTAKPVNVTGISISGAGASNYTLANTTASTTASITAKPITVTAVPDTKLYDGTTTSTGIPKVSSAAVAGDKTNFIQTFDSRVVGGRRKLTPSGSVTDGNAGKNYAVTFVAITVPGGGVITARTVIGGITAASKTYDRTTSATIAGRTLTGALSSDAVTLSGGTGTFGDPNAGSGKTVTATGLSLSGADADNYDLSSTTATAKADITKANQVINFAPIDNKIFNVDGPFKIVATATSGLPVTFALTAGPAKLNGTEVTITGVGKITITATQAGDSNYNPAETVQKFFAAVPPPALLNISTRGRVGTQDNVLIGGYIVRGVEEKKFAARAIGPSLKTKDTPQVVVDPLLELHGPDGALIGKNDNFAQTQLAEIQAAQLVPTNALESVLIKGAMPGNYTAIVKDKREANGIGLVELYDLSQNSNSSLANLSTRGVVGAGADVLIGGFIVNGKVGAAKVILRAIGPSLAEAGIANTLPNPTMELRDHNGVLLGSNNDWQDDPSKAALIQASGIPPKNALESALLTSLPPGNYTVIIADKDGKTGVGLVEIYDVTY
jgi:hypothetical protein